jgi:hypothetical protein
MQEIWFHDLFETGKPEYLSTLLLNKYGYVDPNPGPVVAYPPNLGLFPVGIPELLPTGTQIAIPWTRTRIQKQIGIDTTLLRERKDGAARAVKALTRSFDEANRVGMTVDVVAAVALLMFGAGKMAADVQKVLSAGTASAKLTAAQVEQIVLNMKKTAVLGSYPGISVAVGLDPTAFVGKGAWWQNLVRHTLSLTSPSYWASAVASAWTGDWDLWKYGAEGVRDQGVARILRNFAKEAGGITLRIAAMKRQFDMRFYDYRVTQSETVHPIPGWMRAAA